MKSIAPKLFAVMIALGPAAPSAHPLTCMVKPVPSSPICPPALAPGEPGMTFNTQWAHSDNDGDSVGLGMGYNFNLGPFLMTLGGKGVYLNPKDGDEGYAIAAGGGAELPLGQYFTLFGEGYYSPDSMSSGVDDYVEANAGLRINVLPSLNIEAGYRYIDMAGKMAIVTTPLPTGPMPGLTSAFNPIQDCCPAVPVFSQLANGTLFSTRLISCRPATLFSLR